MQAQSSQASTEKMKEIAVEVRKDFNNTRTTFNWDHLESRI